MPFRHRAVVGKEIPKSHSEASRQICQAYGLQLNLCRVYSCPCRGSTHTSTGLGRLQRLCIGILGIFWDVIGRDCNFPVPLSAYLFKTCETFFLLWTVSAMI